MCVLIGWYMVHHIVEENYEVKGFILRKKIEKCGLQSLKGVRDDFM